MNVSREEKKVEALARMEKMGYWKPAKEQFRRANKVLVNEPPFGAVYEMEPELAKQVEEFESRYSALVYMVVRAFTAFGTCDSLLYVSDYPEEWGYDNADIEDGIVMTYTINNDAPECSEFGSIGYRLGAGAGLIRVA